MNHALSRTVMLAKYVGKQGVFLAASVLLLISSSSKTNAQCLQDSFSPGRVYKTTGDPRLDASFNQEGSLLYAFFGVSPNMFIFDDGQSPNAFASPVNTLRGYSGTVYFGIGLLRDELWSMNKGGYAVAGIMAHEFAHILQVGRKSRLSGNLRELHADYMAGYYLGRKSYIAPTNIQAFAKSLYEKGDYDFWSPSHHGTPEERVSAMVAGFQARNLSLFQAFDQGEGYVSRDSATTDDNPSTNHRNLNSFLSFLGVKYGDTIEDAKRIFGEPNKSQDIRSSIVLHYFTDGLRISCDQSTGVIKTLGVKAEDAVRRIKSKGFSDEKLTYIGKRWSEIRNIFGSPVSSSNQNYEYWFSDTNGREGSVTFICYEFDDYRCSEVEIQWFYSRR